MSPKLFISVVSLEARKSMSYRVDFWLNAVVGFIAQLGVAYFLWKAIFSESTQAVLNDFGKPTLGGFTFEGMLVYYVLAILLGKMARGFADEQFMAQEIYDGGLTRYIVYPTSYPPFKYAQQIGGQVPAIVQLGLFSAVVPFFLDLPPDMRVSLGSVAMAAGCVAAANLLSFSIYYPIQGVAFWADNVWSLNVMARFAMGLLGGAMLPVSLFPDLMQRILEWLPFKYLFYVPVMAALGRVGPGEWLFGMAITIAWALAFLAIGREVWRRGHLAYTGVGI